MTAPTAPAPAVRTAETADGIPVLAAADWQALRAAHEATVGERTAAHLARRSRGETHPVEDFLFTYYPFKPGKLARWQPGARRAVEIATADDRASFDRRWFRFETPAPRASGAASSGAPSGPGTRSADDAHTGTCARVDLPAWRAERGDGARFIAGLLASTLEREATLGCFGLHEWAMVYRQSAEDHRHRQVPLRLSQADTNAVVESHRIRCSHFDAFRFFTSAAAPLNTLQPTRAGMRANEQPGCLHAGMDLYKWAMKLEPIVPSETVLTAFDLACGIRRLDMEASPYDLGAWGYSPVRIETAAGKAEYMRRQEEFSLRAQAIRRTLLDDLAAAGITV